MAPRRELTERTVRMRYRDLIDIACAARAAQMGACADVALDSQDRILNDLLRAMHGLRSRRRQVHTGGHLP